MTIISTFNSGSGVG